MSEITFLPVLILIVMANLFIGSFLSLKPALSIEIQIKFYEKINWRIEPISVEKEMRNTKIMGLFLIIITLSGLVYYVFLEI